MEDLADIEFLVDTKIINLKYPRKKAKMQHKDEDLTKISIHLTAQENP